MQPTQQSQTNEYGSIKQPFEDAQSYLGDGVVGGTLMASQPDFGGELFGNVIAMRHDVSDLARGQPNPDTQHDKQQHNKKDSEHVT